MTDNNEKAGNRKNTLLYILIGILLLIIVAMGILTFTAYETISSGMTVVEDIREDVHESVNRVQQNISEKFGEASEKIDSLDQDFKDARENLRNSFRD